TSIWKCARQRWARYSSRKRSVRRLGAARPRPVPPRKQRGRLAGSSPMSGGRAAALLLVGVLIGGISGGAAATYLVSRTAPQATAAPTASPSTLPVVSAAPVTGPL